LRFFSRFSCAAKCAGSAGSVGAHRQQLPRRWSRSDFRGRAAPRIHFDAKGLVVARVEIEAIAQRVLVLGVRQADVGAPGVLRGVHALDDLRALFHPADQQPDTLVWVGRLGLFGDGLAHILGK